MEDAVVLLSLKKNDEEEVRVSSREYKDRKYIDLRIWFKPKDGGKMAPTKKGLTLSEDLFLEMVAKLTGKGKRR